MNPYKNLQVLISAKYIPVGSTVTKATGSKPYIIKEEICIYGETVESNRKIVCDEGTKFLVSENGDINCISDSKVLKWETDINTVIDI